jgi:hypothetical protein
VLETPHGLRVDQVPRKNLDGDIAAEAGILSAVNLAHAALANERQDLVTTELCAGRQGHKD